MLHTASTKRAMPSSRKHVRMGASSAGSGLSFVSVFQSTELLRVVRTVLFEISLLPFPTAAFPERELSSRRNFLVQLSMLNFSGRQPYSVELSAFRRTTLTEQPTTRRAASRVQPIRRWEVRTRRTASNAFSHDGQEFVLIAFQTVCSEFHFQNFSRLASSWFRCSKMFERSVSAHCYGIEFGYAFRRFLSGFPAALV